MVEYRFFTGDGVEWKEVGGMRGRRYLREGKIGFVVDVFFSR